MCQCPLDFLEKSEAYLVQSLTEVLWIPTTVSCVEEKMAGC